MIKHWFIAAIFACPLLAFAADSALSQIRDVLSQRYPKTSIREVRETPMPGIYEVRMAEHVAYTDASGRYMLFGHLYDMQLQSDLTVDPTANKTDFPKEYLANALKTVRGDGSRMLAVFSDPDCSYCRDPR